MRTKLVVAALMLVAAVFVAKGQAAAPKKTPPKAPPVAAAASQCDRLTIGKTSWLVIVRGVSCTSAGTLVKSLASKPMPKPPLYRFTGTFQGMVCARRTTGIYCALTTSSSKLINARPTS
jgi:hypothetical protein